MGELTDVASAKRGVRGCLKEESEDELDDLVRTRGSGRLLEKLARRRLARVLGSGSLPCSLGILIGKTRKYMGVRWFRGNRRESASRAGEVKDAFDERKGLDKYTRGRTREVLQIETSYREKSRGDFKRARAGLLSRRLAEHTRKQCSKLRQRYDASVSEREQKQ